VTPLVQRGDAGKTTAFTLLLIDYQETAYKGDESDAVFVKTFSEAVFRKQVPPVCFARLSVLNGSAAG